MDNIILLGIVNPKTGITIYLKATRNIGIAELWLDGDGSNSCYLTEEVPFVSEIINEEDKKNLFKEAQELLNEIRRK